MPILRKKKQQIRNSVFYFKIALIITLIILTSTLTLTFTFTKKKLNTKTAPNHFQTCKFHSIKFHCFICSMYFFISSPKRIAAVIQQLHKNAI